MNFIEELKKLTESEDLLAVSRDVSELKLKFEDYVLEEERKVQVAQLEAQEKGEEAPEQEGDFGKAEFYEIYNAYRTKKKEIVDAQKAEETKNLGLKRALIKKLQDLVSNEENIGAAFASFNKIREEWKEIGDISRDKRHEVQNEYSKLIEDFFYNINIYKELKEHDYHRNHQLKENIIQKLKGLAKVESIKEIEEELKVIQHDWEDIGPVPNEAWEELKNAYWTEVRSVYERINRFYDNRREEQRVNIEKKNELIEEAKNVLASSNDLNSSKAWENKTKELIDIQKKWKEIGFGPRKENEAVWKSFRAVCDEFFDKKKVFFDKVHDKFDVIAEKKKELCDRADELKTSQDWKITANKLIQLQRKWKELGHAGKRHEQKLWKRFRSACDEFFEARQAYFSKQDEEFEGNLKAKEALIEEIKAFKLPETKKEALDALKNFAEQFNAIGKVPMKVKDKVYKAFKSALDTHYSSLKLEGQEKEETLFQAEIDTIKASSDSGRRFNAMKYDLRTDIDKLKREIIQLENNLGFFANSKGANKLKDEVEKKIAKANDQIDNIKAKLKMIPNE